MDGEQLPLLLVNGQWLWLFRVLVLCTVCRDWSDFMCMPLFYFTWRKCSHQNTYWMYELSLTLLIANKCRISQNFNGFGSHKVYAERSIYDCKQYVFSSHPFIQINGYIMLKCIINCVELCMTQCGFSLRRRQIQTNGQTIPPINVNGNTNVIEWSNRLLLLAPSTYIFCIKLSE